MGAASAVWDCYGWLEGRRVYNVMVERWAGILKDLTNHLIQCRYYIEFTNLRRYKFPLFDVKGGQPDYLIRS
jgi:hypothetical protein